MAAVSPRDLPLPGSGHRPQVLVIPHPGLCPPALRFSGGSGGLGLSAGTRVVPELFNVCFVSSQKLLLSLQPVLELGDLIEHQVEVPLAKLVDSLPLFGGEVFHGHVTCHVLDVHQTPERFAHIHVLQGRCFTGKRRGLRPLVAALQRQMLNSDAFVFGICREQTQVLERSAIGVLV